MKATPYRGDNCRFNHSLSDTWVWPGRMARKARQDGRFDGPPDDTDHGPACQCADCMWDETDTDSMMASWERRAWEEN